VTWHKLLERVCDVMVTSAPPASGETRQYVYDECDVYDEYDVQDVSEVWVRPVGPDSDAGAVECSGS
jgi:hypothetical protein